MNKLVTLLFFFSLQSYAFADSLINDWKSVSKSQNVSCKNLVLLKEKGEYDEHSANKKQLDLVKKCVLAVAEEQGY
jgi:hypothetical protein